MNNRGIDVSIIIVSYNVKELLLKCIESIYKYTGKNISFEIIVVDNNSFDKSADAINQRFNNVTLIRNTNNIGFPAANNQGIKLSKGRYIFLLNPDTELIEDSLTPLIQFMEENIQISIGAPQLLNSDRTIQNSVFRFPRISYIAAEMFYLESLIQGKYYKEKDINTVFKVDSASGAALLFQRELTDKIGMLNENLFWIEDIDFCYRVLKAGGSVYYFPQTKIVHHSGQSAKKNYNVSISNMVINKIKFYKVHKSVLSLAIVYLLSFLNVIMRFLVFALLSPFNGIYYLKMKAYAYTFTKLFSAAKGVK